MPKINKSPRSRRQKAQPEKVAKLDTPGSAGPLINEILARYRTKSRKVKALSECMSLLRGRGNPEIAATLLKLSPAWHDHAIASVYAALMPNKKRKRLGAYFTPPHLVEHLVARLQGLGLDLASHKLRDPAAGGAAFLVPLARIKVRTWRASGLSDRRIIALLKAQLHGKEIEPDLAKLANSLLRNMLIKEFGISNDLVKKLELVRTGDSLLLKPERMADHEIGNPPYLRLARSNRRKLQDEFDDIASGRLNLYTMFIRRSVDRIPAEGMMGYVVPSSFLGGPEFSMFRRRILQLAEVLVIDVVEKRSDVFLDAIQDACFIILKKRPRPIAVPPISYAESGVLKSNGEFSVSGKAVLDNAGGAWKLPGSERASAATLIELGYKGVIGYLVSNRQKERLYKQSGKGRYPLIWAKAISVTGKFDFERGVKHKNLGWVEAPASAHYIVKNKCVAVQRTSSRGQKRRLNAAAIGAKFIKENGGIVAENHVILLIPCRSDAWSPSKVAKILNAPAASEELDRVCGSASISVRLLERIRFPTAIN